jgi:hypothetical protein
MAYPNIPFEEMSEEELMEVARTGKAPVGSYFTPRTPPPEKPPEHDPWGDVLAGGVGGAAGLATLGIPGAGPFLAPGAAAAASLGTSAAYDEASGAPEKERSPTFFRDLLRNYSSAAQGAIAGQLSETPDTPDGLLPVTKEHIRASRRGVAPAPDPMVDPPIPITGEQVRASQRRTQPIKSLAEYGPTNRLESVYSGAGMMGSGRGQGRSISERIASDAGNGFVELSPQKRLSAPRSTAHYKDWSGVTPQRIERVTPYVATSPLRDDLVWDPILKRYVYK